MKENEIWCWKKSTWNAKNDKKVNKKKPFHKIRYVQQISLYVPLEKRIRKYVLETHKFVFIYTCAYITAVKNAQYFIEYDTATDICINIFYYSNQKQQNRNKQTKKKKTIWSHI